MQTVGVIGLGYAGLPLALRFALASTQKVIGFDTDETKVRRLERGESYLGEISSQVVADARATNRFTVTANLEFLAHCDTILICVPTPLGPHREPDLTYVLDSGRAIGKTLRQGQTVILESTTYPGTTDGELRTVLERASHLRAGVDFHLAYSAERIDPGNSTVDVWCVPKVVGGFTSECAVAAQQLYRQVFREVVMVSSCKVAEAGKLLENIFRCVNIALVNELKMIYAEMGIDVWEVIASASTKPYGFMPFFPGPGLGGHCIPVDPFYLTWKACEFGHDTRFIELAGKINASMPRYVVDRLQEALNQRSRPLRGSRILVLGLAYKPDLDDTRESPSFAIMHLLEKGGAEVSYYDPYIPILPRTRKYLCWHGKISVPWDKETIAAFDAVLISTAHRIVDYEILGTWASLIIDTRNAMADFPEFASIVIKA